MLSPEQKKRTIVTLTSRDEEELRDLILRIEALIENGTINEPFLNQVRNLEVSVDAIFNRLIKRYFSILKAGYEEKPTS